MTTEPPGQATAGKRRTFVVVALLVAAGAVGALAVRSFLRIESVHETITLAPLDDPKELTARKRDVVGTFATGAASGDRAITVRADGTIAFSEIGADPATSRTEDTWTYRRREKKFALATTQSGIVDIVNIDTLAYFGDTYRRTK